MRKIFDLLFKKEDQIVDITTIAYWRQMFFAIVVGMNLVGGGMLLTMGLFVVSDERKMQVLPFGIIALLIFAATVGNKKLPKYFRYVLEVSALYACGIFMLLFIHNHLIGDMYILLSFVVAAFLLNSEDIRALMIINFITLMLMSRFFIGGGIQYFPIELTFSYWIYYVATLTMVSTTIVLLIDRLLQGLESMIDEIKMNDEHTKSIFNSMSSGVITIDDDGMIMDMNDFIMDFFQISKRQYLNLSINDLIWEVTDGSESRVHDFFERMQASHDTLEVELKKKTKTLYINCKMTRLQGKDVNRGVYVLIFYDVTDIREATIGMIHASKMEAIGTIAGGIAHDFNNMLGGILGYAQLNAGLIGKDSDTARTYNDKIIDASIKSSALTKQLLTFARKEEVNSIRINLNDAVNEVVSLMERTFEKKIRIDKKLSSEDVFIEGDITMIENTLLNIGINAKDAMEQDGVLKITTDATYLDRNYCDESDFLLKAGRYAVLTFHDEGHGMDEATRKRIFEPFFTTKEVGRGTGLGMSAAYGTVVAHNGEIRISSEKSIGTTIEILIPVAEQVDTEAADNVVAVSPDLFKENALPVSRGKLLVVDDEDIIRGLLVEMLEMDGYQVMEAANGEEALAIYEKEHTGLNGVFLDLIMPGIGGKECMARMKALTLDVPIAIISGFMKDESQDSLYKVGADVILSKPFTVTDVMEVLERWQGINNESNG